MRRRVFVFFVATAMTSVVWAYDERVHTFIEASAFVGQDLALPLLAPAPDDLTWLRREIWRAGAKHSDPSIQEEFLKRYPNEFDNWSFKQFLGLNPDAVVLGIDKVPALPMPLTPQSILPLGARLPDDDGRNRERYAHDAKRNVLLDRWGRALPADPLQLTMGGLSGLSSQAYAHYGLPKLHFSDDPDVLKSDPRRFAYPKNARAFAAEFAQMHTDLAICAAMLGTDGGVTLGWFYLGNAHHYLGDVANQIHTLQAIYPFFRRAKIESYKEDVRSLGGLLRTRPDMVSIAIQLIENHHVLAETLMAKRIDEQLQEKPTPHVAVNTKQAVTLGDADFDLRLNARKLSSQGLFGQTITEELIEVSSHEGAAVYQSILTLAKKRFSQAGEVYLPSMDPDQALKKDTDAQVLQEFYRLQIRGLARAGSALRRHLQLFQEAVGPRLYWSLATPSNSRDIEPDT